MAIYPYKCEACGEATEVVQSIISYSNKPDVPHCCRGAMVRIMTAPMISFDTPPWAAYQSPIDGTVIDSRAKRNEHMATHGVVMYDDIAPDIARRRAEIQAAAVADIKTDIIESVHKIEAGHKPQIIPEAELIPGA